MADIVIRYARVKVFWQESPAMTNQKGAETALRVMLGLAAASLTGTGIGSHSPSVTIAINGDKRNWRIARLMIKPDFVAEVLYVRQLFSDTGSDIGADYVLAEMDKLNCHRGGDVIQKVASVTREDDGMLYCMGGPGDVWEEEWDEVFHELRKYRRRYE
jgi:hypothetical protein